MTAHYASGTGAAVPADAPRRPGSPEATAAGCQCPARENHGGAGVAGNAARYGWWINAGCPLHGNGGGEW